MKIPKTSVHIVLAAIHLEPGPEAVPLGAASVAAALKHVFNQNSAVPDFPSGSVSLLEGFISDGIQTLVGKIKEKNPQCLGFSLYNWNRSQALKIAERLRSENPDIFLFCGGPEVTALPEGLHTSQGGPFDLIVQGEGESAAAQVIEHALSHQRLANSTIKQAFLSEDELAQLPSPWLDKTLKPADREGILWELARGCPYQCYYCYESKGERRVRYFKEERLRAELRLFLKEGVRYVFVLDPTFNSNKPRAIRILDMISQEMHQYAKSAEIAPIHWHFEVRAEQLDREQIRRFAGLGASLQIGLQTAHRQTAETAGRSFNKRLFTAKIHLLNEAGVIFGLDLIYGLPGDNLAGYRQSLDFALSCYPNNLDMFRLSVLPGTVFADKQEELRIHTQGEAPYKVISTPGFPAAALDQAERLSQSTDVFYNQGRAVAWFNQVLKPLNMKPSAFLEGFADYLEQVPAPKDVFGIEKNQLAYLTTVYRKAQKEALFPAVTDLVTFHSAWNRALAEGFTTKVDFNYHPNTILGPEGLDIETFVRRFKRAPTQRRIRPGKNGPELV